MERDSFVSDFVNGSQVLQGAELDFGTSTVRSTSDNEATAPTSQAVTGLSKASAATPIFTAAKDQGLGTWLSVYDPANITLKVPKAQLEHSRLIYLEPRGWPSSIEYEMNSQTAVKILWVKNLFTAVVVERMWWTMNQSKRLFVSFFYFKSDSSFFRQSVKQRIQQETLGIKPVFPENQINKAIGYFDLLVAPNKIRHWK